MINTNANALSLHSFCKNVVLLPRRVLLQARPLVIAGNVSGKNLINYPTLERISENICEKRYIKLKLYSFDQKTL